MSKKRRTTDRTSNRPRKNSLHSSPEPELKPFTSVKDGEHERTGRVRMPRAAGTRSNSGPSPFKQREAATQTSYYASNSERQVQSESESDTASSGDSTAELLPPFVKSIRRLSGLPVESESEMTASTSSSTTTRTSDFLVVKPVPTHGFAASMFDSIPRNSGAFTHLLPNSPMLSRALSPGPNPLLAAAGGPRRRGSPSPLQLDSQNIPAAGPGSPRHALRPIIIGPRFRSDVLIEVAILTSALALACYRMNSIPRTTIFNPASPLLVLTCLVPFLSLFRRSAPSTHLMVPFTDERGYRSRATADDGFACGVGLPVVLASAVVWDGYLAESRGTVVRLPALRLLPEIWDTVTSNTALTSQLPEMGKVLLEARKSLLVLMTLNSFVLILQLLLARTVLRVNWIPTSNTKRFFGAVALSSIVSGLAGIIVLFCTLFGFSTSYIHAFELMCSTYVYQMSLYLISRLARRAFTLGELAMVTSAGVSLLLDFGRLVHARWQYKRNPMLPQTFRAPTPIIAFQHVLIPGVFLAGFLLSPLLVISRNLASKPSYRLRWPEQKERNRRLLALGVLIGLFLIVFGGFGFWMGYVLKGSIWRAWIWAFQFNVFGGDGIDGMQGQWRGWKRWHRLGIASYWLATVILAIAGWQTRLVRARRTRLTATASTSEKMHAEASREDKRIHVSLDLRRKFFHGLAMLIFVPGIAYDAAFTSLAFSLAFSVFTLAEFARYFALYPIGAPIHVFFHEFVDSKDSGPVVLSHFYLLTGCAGPLWLEGSGIKQYAGVLALGVGDAMASLVGRRVGGLKWPGTNKTIIGSLAFVASVIAVSSLLVLIGWTEPYNSQRYLFATVLTAILEASTTQNDNLTIPIFFWAAQVLLTKL